MSAEQGPGRYRIIRLLGRGGLGEVYLAEDTKLRREVAIKFIAADKIADENARRRFKVEALAAGTLDHPCICAVWDHDAPPDGRAYIVMQYVEGQPLSAVLARGAMPPREALDLCGHVAEALGVAHHKGVIHRDVKPSNIMVTPSGLPKLVDFGIAKVIAETAGSHEGTTTTGEPLTEGIIGTPAYMSPEQLQQQPLDGRSDLFSLGAVLFECLTGRRAFDGRTMPAIAAQVLHEHPPAPSSLRPGLGQQEDELCRRLLAKDRADRFQSADEVVGAIRLLHRDTSRDPLPVPSPAPARRRPRGLRWLIAASVVVLAAIGVAMWNRSAGLPAVPPDAEDWYRRGTEAIRQGAYESGRKALNQAVALFPQYALAYARLAEADAELDDMRAAKDHLLRVSRIVPDDSRLPVDERLRLQAVRAIVLRDVDACVESYRQLVDRSRNDPGTWLDLGRAQDAAGHRWEARASFGGAIARDKQYAAAYLRLGVLEGQGAHSDQSKAAFSEAERLYRARSDVEGETEVLIRRAALNTVGQPKAARVDLERALKLAADSKNHHQQVRARLLLSSATASEGLFEESKRMAEDAVNEALESGLETVAADGLVDLSSSLMQSEKTDEAEAEAKRAIALADKQGARMTAARARIGLASVYVQSRRPQESLDTLRDVLPFLKENRYRRLELTAQSIAGRAYTRLDELDEARRLCADVLTAAEALKDDVQEAIAANNMAVVLTSLGQLPEALRLRQRAEDIHRRLADDANLPFDLTNRADLLIRLGRAQEADALLAQVDQGIDAGIDSYVLRRDRVTFLRAFGAATRLRCDVAVLRLSDLARAGPQGGAAGTLAPVIGSFCDARLHRPSSADATPLKAVVPSLASEGYYWLAAAAMERQNAASGLDHARQGLTLLGQVPNDELRWRLATVAAAAATRLKNAATATEMAGTAQAAVERLQAAWKADFGTYERRADLVALRNRANRN